MVSRLAVAAALLVLAGPVPTAGSVSNGGLVVGFDDDLPKQSGAAVAAASDAGAGALRFTLQLSSGETALTAADKAG